MSLRRLVRRYSWARAIYNRAGRPMTLARRARFRARFEAELALAPVANLIDRTRRPDVRYWDIDVDGLSLRFPPARRRVVARAAAASLAETDNVFYFQNVSWYNWRHRNLPRGLPALDDIYPPNLAVLDFLARHVRTSDDEVLLDFACGIGTLLVYARDLGFPRVHGFDAWKYLARLTAVRFLERFGLGESALVEADALASLPATIVTCIGYPLDMAMATSDVWAAPSVRYLLVDRLNRPATLPGYRRTGEYAGLITIFEKRAC
jgi:hypothetical protein